MTKQYIALNNRVIFKFRYGKWNLIKINKPQERFVVNKNEAQILKSLFSGKSISEVGREFRVNKNDIKYFLQPILNEKIINPSFKSKNFLSQCFDINPPLDSLNILLTNSCNLRCAHCYVNAGKKLEKELSGSDWMKTIEEAKKLGVFSVNISGGEPLLHPDFWKITKFLASKKQFYSNLNTNGTLLKNAHLELLSLAFSSVQISIDGDNQKRHDRFRGVAGCFDSSINAIKMLIDYGIETNVAFSLSPENISSLDGVVKICEDAGVNILNIGLVANIGRAKLNESVFVGRDFLDVVYQKIKNISERKSNLNILFPFRFNKIWNKKNIKKKYICDGDNNQILFIMADGTAMPCDKLPPDIFGCGNVMDKSLSEIWLSKKMTTFKLMENTDILECKNCNLLKICGGACVARSFQKTGSLHFGDFASCIMANKCANV